MTNEELIQKLNEMDIQVNFKSSDMRKFFALAVAANVASYLVMSAAAGYVLVKVGKMAKKNEAKQDKNPTSVIKTEEN